MLPAARIATITCGLIAIALGSGAIYGWHTGNTQLVSLFPDLPPLSHGCGVGLVLAGATVLMLVWRHRRWALILGAATALTGLLGISDTLARLIPLDALRLPQVVNPYGLRSGPIGLNSSLCLFLGGILGILLAMQFTGKRRHLHAWLLGLPIILIALVAFFGYLSGLAFTYDWTRLAPMSAHGTVAFLALGIGLFLYAWREEVDRQTVSFLFWGVVLPVSVIGVAQVFFPNWRSEYHAAHAALETVGAVTGAGLGYLLYQHWKNHRTFELLVPATALTVSGMLGLVHAFIDDGNAFVWLYTLANLATGITMALVWLPPWLRNAMHRPSLLWIALALSFAAGLLSLLFPQYMPPMMNGATFSKSANTLNLAAGILFLVAAGRFMKYHRENRADYTYTIALICLVFGASGILFQASQPWNAAWWAWHGLRFGACAIGLLYITNIMASRETELRAAHARLQDQLEIIRKTSHERDVEHAQLLAIFDGIEELIYVIDPESRTLIYVNDTFRRVFGHDVLHRPYREVLYGHNTSARSVEDSGRILKSGSVIRVREIFNKKNSRWYRAATKPVRWADGRTMRFELAVDITDLKETEEALRKAEEQLRLAMDSAGMGTWDYDVAADRVSLDDRLRLLFGLDGTVNPMLLDTALSHVHGDARKNLLDEISRAIENRNETHTRFNISLEDGSIRSLATRGRVYRNAEGAAVRLVGVCWDETESKAAEQALRESKARLQAVLDNSATLIYMKDRAGRYLLANRQFARVVRREPERIIGMTDDALWPAVAAENEKTSDLMVLETSSPFRREEIVPYPDGDHTIYLVKFPMRDAKGEIHAVAAVGTDITERKKQEGEIARLTERLQVAAKSARIGIWDFDITKNELIWDDIMYELYGVDPSEFEGAFQAWQQCVHPDDLPRADAEVDAAINGNIEFETDFRVVWRDGTVRYLQAYGTVIRDLAGQPRRMVGANWDITARRVTEEALRDREEHFRALMEQAADAFFVLNEEGYIVETNKRACESLGYSRDELLGKGPWEFDSDFSFDRVEETLKRIAAGDPITVEGCHQRCDGSRFPVELRIGKIHTAGTLAFLASARDITDRRVAEKALRESENRLRSLTDTVPCAIYRCALDEHWTMDYMSAQIEQVTGYPSDDFIGNRVRSYASIIYPKDRHMVDDSVHTAIDQAAPFIIDYRINHADGSVRWVHEEGRGVRAEDGQIGYLDGFILDQTVRMEAELALQERTRELQETVAELNRINQDLDQFAYVASHDLQEPLRTLVTYSGFLQEDLANTLTHETKEDFRLLMEAAGRMQALVRDLLAFSRSGRAAMDRQWVPLDGCVDDALANLRAHIDDSGATIDRQPLPDLEADHTLITQVFQNLISNALKFRGDTAPHIEITAEHKNDRWVVGVKDNGIGVEPEYAELIFAPFKRLHSIRDYAGSGIGLAVARRVVERHGGAIWVESDPGQGAHFRFTLGTWKGTQDVYAPQESSADSPR